MPEVWFQFGASYGKRLSDFQAEKWEKHSDLLRGRDIGLYGGMFNASFDNYGDSSIEDLVRYTQSYGHRSKLPSRGGRYENDVAVAFIPEIMGSGVSIRFTRRQDRFRVREPASSRLQTRHTAMRSPPSTIG
jgi:hypothetical protein